MNREAWWEKGGRVEKERRRQSLGQERTPRSPKRSNFTEDPRESQTGGGNQMVTPLASDIIRQRHTFTGALCTSYSMPTLCIGKQLPEEAVARGNSCLKEKRDAVIITESM